MGNYEGYVNPLIHVNKENLDHAFRIESYMIMDTDNYACLVNNAPSELPLIQGVSYSDAVFNGIVSNFKLPDGWTFNDEGWSETEYPLDDYDVIQP